jgi:hypothetical protein
VQEPGGERLNQKVLGVMADMNFGCPHCGQAITCDSAWAGQEIKCPICQGGIIAPAPEPGAASAQREAHSPLVPKPPPGGGGLKFTQNAQQPAKTGRDVPVRNLAPPPPKKKSKLVSILVTVVVLAAVGVGAYYGWNWVSEKQHKMNAAAKEREKNSDGGEVGHTMELYEVLDRTEPGGNIGGSRSRATGPRQKQSGVGAEIPVGSDEPTATGAANAAPATPKAVIPPTWTLEVATAKIPESKVNGKISGTNFVAETATIMPSPTAQVLRLTQGQLASPDREVLVYLHLKPGEKLGGQTLKIANDMRGSTMPTVTKRWKTNPRFAPTTKSFSTGYAMNLELGQATNGFILGKIYLALPDTEQTVVAGIFSATVPQAGDPLLQPATVAPTPAAPVNNLSPNERQMFERRYGVTPK